MAELPARIASRLAAGLKRFQPILASAKARDVNESDTVVLVADLLQEVFGYDKYTEVTSEHVIRGTYCDLSVKVDGELRLLAEVKAIGMDLKDTHVKQVVDYAANQGADWVALTTGAIWRIYRVSFGKPISQELVVEFNLLTMDARKGGDLEILALLARESWQKAKLGEYHSRKQALSRFCLAAVVLSDTVIDVIRREVRRVSPEVRVENDELRDVLKLEVLKRDVIEGEQSDLARRQVAKAAKRSLRSASPAESEQASAPKAGD